MSAAIAARSVPNRAAHEVLLRQARAARASAPTGARGVQRGNPLHPPEAGGRAAGEALTGLPFKHANPHTLTCSPDWLPAYVDRI